MAVITKYRPGMPCWVDLSTVNVDESVGFYGQIFGWTIEFDEIGGYGQFYRRDKSVAGIGSTMGPESPTLWNIYIATDDAAKSVELAREAGANIVAEPMEITGEGTVAVFQDPTGAYVGVWQADQHEGAELINEPGSVNLFELVTNDVEEAKSFYGKVFGWTPGIPAKQYTPMLSEGSPVAGMLGIDDRFPAEIPPRWLVYFGTANLDATIDQALGLGGRVLLGPVDVPGTGRFAVFGDPMNAPFAAWQAA
ncbi:VOC family protein [Acrocarpospora macrocephala]|uniref:Hydroxylase n=1 Tax=Acrocarpospora macrocephala TaxID=150177 RepID=A0A5M3WTG1_9ACTN|nr:VOC family protein [Acrocarpospora macrocephala]GES11329.1 hydroxylase [Acrocarpospora macrocephala]